MGERRERRHDEMQKENKEGWGVEGLKRRERRGTGMIT